jgi:hypothetical protein
MRGSFLGGCSGQWEADGGGPRRAESRRSGGRRQRWWSEVWAIGGQTSKWNEKRGNWCYS